MKEISIIIPAFNEAEYLSQTIASLNDQDFPRDQYEIIVVDNNSADDSSSVARKAGADKVIKEIKQGTNAARQRGIKESEGRIVALIDADCVAPRAWVSSIHLAFHDPRNADVGMAFGIYDYYDIGIINRFVALFSQNFLIPVWVWLSRLIYRHKVFIAPGGNMSLRREAIEAIGGLNTDYVFWGDDVDTVLRISDAGYRILRLSALTVKSSGRRFQNKNALELIGIFLVYVRAAQKRFSEEKPR